MRLTNDVHQQLADFFPSELKPFIYTLSKKLSGGHISVDINKLDKNILDDSVYSDYPGKEILEEDPLVSKGEHKAPFVLLNDQLYFERYFHYETIILDRIKAFIKTEAASSPAIYAALQAQAQFIKQLFNGNLYNKTDNHEVNWQLVAAVSAALNSFTIITGGPGTGKTTTVAKILSILFQLQPDLKVAICAPTGKAAARVGESLQHAAEIAGGRLKENLEALEPSTIHRLLGNINNSPYFKHNQDNTLKYDIVIADESSMIDVALFAKLMAAIGPETKLILLGDKDQLASVEAGSLFGDLCDALESRDRFSQRRVALVNFFIDQPQQKLSTSDAKSGESFHLLTDHIIELRQSHRFSDEKGIGKFSKAVIENRAETIGYFLENEDAQVSIDTTFSKMVFENFVAGYEAYIREPDISKALKRLQQLRVLCAVREGPEGLYALNRKIETYLQSRQLIQKTHQYYLHRPIMVTRNNSDLQLFNGDIGIIRPDEQGVLKAWFESSGPDRTLKSVTPGYINQPETVFAMTIHKSQGSEFDKVLIALPKTELQLLTRELLYTAITRARQSVILQGSTQSIFRAAEAYIDRGSGIIQRMQMQK